MIGSEDAGLQEAAAGCLLNMRQLAMANERAKYDKESNSSLENESNWDCIWRVSKKEPNITRYYKSHWVQSSSSIISMYCLQCICSFIKNELQLIEIQYFYCKLAVAYLLLTVFNDSLIFPLIPFRLLVPCEQRSLPPKEPLRRNRCFRNILNLPFVLTGLMTMGGHCRRCRNNLRCSVFARKIDWVWLTENTSHLNLHEKPFRE